MDKISTQAMEFVFNQFKNQTISEGKFSALSSAFGIYLRIFVAAKILYCVPRFLDGVILIIQKVGELSDIVVQTAPKFLAGFVQFFELIKSLIHFVIWYFLTPIRDALYSIGCAVYWICYWVYWGVTYLINGCKWPETEIKIDPTPKIIGGSTPSVPTQPVGGFSPARDSRNSYHIINYDQ